MNKETRMAEVRLGRFELGQGGLPAVCMCCGTEAAHQVRRDFTWQGAGQPFRRMTFYVPLCDQHLGHWSARAQFNALMLLFALGTAGGLLLLSGVVEWKGPTTLILALGAVIVGLVWLALDSRIDAGLIKATEISESAITLRGVSEEFVAELEKKRALLRPKQDEPKEDDFRAAAS